MLVAVCPSIDEIEKQEDCVRLQVVYYLHTIYLHLFFKPVLNSLDV
jgi:hypothetical protein